MGLLFLGGFIAIIAALGHVPRIKFGDTEMDTSVAYWAGAVAGAERAGDAIGELLADSPEREQLLDEAVRAVAVESWSAARSAAQLEGNADALTRSGEHWRRQAQDATEDSGRPESQAQSLAEEPLAILARFANFNPEIDHLTIARELLLLGYRGVPPERRGGRSNAAYLRWIYTGKSRTVRLYQNSAGLISDSQPQVELQVVFLELSVRAGRIQRSGSTTHLPTSASCFKPPESYERSRTPRRRRNYSVEQVAHRGVNRDPYLAHA